MFVADVLPKRLAGERERLSVEYSPRALWQPEPFRAINRSKSEVSQQYSLCFHRVLHREEKASPRWQSTLSHVLPDSQRGIIRTSYFNDACMENNRVDETVLMPINAAEWTTYFLFFHLSFANFITGGLSEVLLIVVDGCGLAGKSSTCGGSVAI